MPRFVPPFFFLGVLRQVRELDQKFKDKPFGHRPLDVFPSPFLFSTQRTRSVFGTNTVSKHVYLYRLREKKSKKRKKNVWIGTIPFLYDY